MVIGAAVTGAEVGLVVGLRVFAAAAAAIELYVVPPTTTVTGVESISAATASAMAMVTLEPFKKVMTAMMEPPWRTH